MTQYCDDCGCKVFGGHCINCHEEVFIAEQYRELGMDVPELIEQKESEQIYNLQ